MITFSEVITFYDAFLIGLGFTVGASIIPLVIILIFVAVGVVVESRKQKEPPKQ